MKKIMTAAQVVSNTTPEPNTGCYLWLGALTGHGYGACRHAGRTMAASRLSWELHRGPIPVGMYVCHRCDHPPCVNPDHLFLGTPRDNMMDMAKKGRGFKRPPMGYKQPIKRSRKYAGFLSDAGARLLLSLTARR